MSSVAFITGASRGIGRATAVRLAADGFDIAVGYRRNRSAAEETGELVRRHGREAMPVQLDIGDADLIGAAARVARTLGPITCVVANATGLDDSDPGAPGRAALRIERARYRAVFEGRVIGLLELAAAFEPDLGEAGGSIVALTSTGTERHIPGYAPLAAAMGATDALVTYLAHELAPRIRVNGVKAGLVDTEAVAHLTDDRDGLIAFVAKRTPLRRVATPDDVADVVAFLASDRARWVTGHQLIADGGHRLT